jgi:hypothetical protein
MDPLSSSIEGSQRHRIDSTTDREAYVKQLVLVQVGAGYHIPSGALPSTPHSSGSIPRRTPANSSWLTGKLLAELYHLGFIPWRKTPAEEHFLNLRTLLLHINSAVASNAPAIGRRRNKERLEGVSECTRKRGRSEALARRSSEVGIPSRCRTDPLLLEISLEVWAKTQHLLSPRLPHRNCIILSFPSLSNSITLHISNQVTPSQSTW